MRIKLLVVIISISLFGLNQASGQLNVDSLRQIIHASTNDEVLMHTYNDYAYQLYRLSADSALFYANKAIVIAQKKQNERELASAYNLLGLAYQTKGLYNLSISYFNKAGAIENYGLANQAKTFHNMALVYRSMNNNNAALKYELQAIKIAEQTGDSLITGVVYQNLCNIYSDLGDYPLAEDYILKSISIFEKLKNTGIDNRMSMLANAHSNYGNLLQVAGRLNEAIAEQEKAIALHAISGDLFNKAIAYENMGNVFLELNKYELALQQYNMAKDLFQSLNSATDVGFELMNISDVLKVNGDYKGALVNLDSALQIFTMNEADSYRRDVFYKKYKIYDETKNAALALSFYKLFNNLNDSINAVQNQEELLRLKEEFESTQKEKEIEFLKTDNALKDKDKQLQIIYRNLAIALLVLFTLFGGLLLNRYRIKQQVKQLEMRNKIASDLHDDIGSTLTSISMYSEIIKTTVVDQPQTAIPLLDKMRSNSLDMIENMSDIVWAIKPANDAFSKIETRMYNYASNIASINGINLFMERNLQLESIKISMEQRRDLYLIFKESINNCVKYAHATELHIKFSLSSKMLTMQIRDNGQGFDTQILTNPKIDNPTNFGGDGLKNMLQRAKNNNAQLNIQSAVGQGTIVTLQLPLG